jgi:hemerythrin
MGQYLYRQDGIPMPDMPIIAQQFTERKQVCDSRYRSIIGHLDLMIEQIRRQPARNLTAELDHLLYAVMDHIVSENTCMELVGFPQAAQHRLHHQFICVNTRELRHRFSKGQYVLPDELAYVRLLWLVHIQSYDRYFEEFLAT